MRKASFNPIQHYIDKAAAIASEMSIKDAVFHDCSCFDVGVYADGAKPHDFKTFKEAAEIYCFNRFLGKRYWGVHIKGRHLTHVHHPIWGNGDNPCCECKKRLDNSRSPP